MPHFQHFTLCHISNSSCNHTLAAEGSKRYFLGPKRNTTHIQITATEGVGEGIWRNVEIWCGSKVSTRRSQVCPESQQQDRRLHEELVNSLTPVHISPTSIPLFAELLICLNFSSVLLAKLHWHLSARCIKSSFSPRNSALSHTNPMSVRIKDTKLQLTQSFFCLKLTI